MSEWKTPKTDWYGAMVDNVYTGDRFNYTDFNRIKNNLVYLEELSKELYYVDYANDDIDDAVLGGYPYASTFNKLEGNWARINDETIKADREATKTWYTNGSMPTYVDYNRLEQGCLKMYESLTHLHDNRRTLTFNFGIREMF